jgi:hypothetical protein
LLAKGGGNTQIYRTVHSGPDLKALGQPDPDPLTLGGSVNIYPSVAAGKMAFQSITEHGAIWSLPADTNLGRVTGPLEKLTTEKAKYGWVASTPDGKILTFSSNRTGGIDDIFLRDLLLASSARLTWTIRISKRYPGRSMPAEQQ